MSICFVSIGAPYSFIVTTMSRHCVRFKIAAELRDIGQVVAAGAGPKEDLLPSPSGSSSWAAVGAEPMIANAKVIVEMVRSQSTRSV
jgi:hypothetical protein